LSAEENSASTRSEWRNGATTVLAAAMGIGLSSAPIYSLGVFVKPLSEAFGWSRTQIVLGQVIVGLVLALTAPFAGKLLDRVGARRMALLGTVIVSAAVGSLSLLHDTVVLYFGIWAGIAAGLSLASSLVWLRAVVDRFAIQQGFALSLALCGSNLAGAVAPVLVAFLIESFNWRTAYAGLGVYMFVSVFPLAYLYFYDASDLRRAQRTRAVARSAPTQELAGIGLIKAMRLRNFWLLAVSFLLAGGGITSFVVYLAPMLIDRGLSQLLAASAVSCISIAALVGRVVGGYLMDRTFAPRLAATALFAAVPACLLLLYAEPTYLYAMTAAALIGLSTGAEYNMITFLCVRYFGMRHLGTMSGVMFSAFAAGSIIVPPLVGMLLDRTHGSVVPLAVLMTNFSLAAGAMLACTRYPTLEPVGNVDKSKLIESAEPL